MIKSDSRHDDSLIRTGLMVAHNYGKYLNAHSYLCILFHLSFNKTGFTRCGKKVSKNVFTQQSLIDMTVYITYTDNRIEEFFFFNYEF